MRRGRSIRIYLPSGEVTGISQRPGVYFLIGAETVGDREVYIGEAENVLVRLKQHLGSKDFWQEVVLFTSKDANLTKAHVKYLENRLIDVADRVGRCRLLNRTGSLAPSLPRADADAMEEFVDNLRVRLGTLGHRFLVPLRVNVGAGPQRQRELRYAIRGAVAHGMVTDEGFLVRAGSTALKDAKKAMGTGNRALKAELVEVGKLADRGTLFEFADDVLFSTPSQAAVIVYGNSTNGRLAWKDASGRSLRETEEASLAGSGSSGSVRASACGGGAT